MRDTLKGFITNPIMLLDEVIKDTQLVKGSEYHVLDVDFWHSSNQRKGKCAVCNAGAIMAFGLGASSDDNLDPDWYDDETGYMLLAVNHIRAGHDRLVAMYFRQLGWDDYINPMELAIAASCMDQAETPSGSNVYMSMKAGSVEGWIAFRDIFHGFCVMDKLCVDGLSAES
jgi:hypothetical protein